MQQPSFDDARRQLDAALGRLADEPVSAAEEQAPLGPPPPASEAATRLAIGLALLGLDALSARGAAWEQAAGIRRDDAQPTDGERFRHGLVGWLFETEAELRPKGNPLQWLQGVAGHFAGSVFAVALDAMPRLVSRRNTPPSEQDTARWAERGRAEERPSKAFAAAALNDAVAAAIPYLAAQPAAQQAIAELVRSPAIDDALVALAARPAVATAIAQLVRSPAMDEAVVALAASPGMQRALAQLAASPAMDEAVTAIVRSPAMERAVTHLVHTRAMEQAIESLSHSPALVALVQRQGSTIAGEIVDEVRERGVSGDIALERLARRLLGRPPRAELPAEAQSLTIAEPVRRPSSRR